MPKPIDSTLPELDQSSGKVLDAIRDDRTPVVAMEGQAPAWITSILHDREPQASTIPLEPGFQIPGTRYQLVDWLGDGGMGVVYEAKHLDLDRLVALKIIREKYCRDDALKAMFRAEARAASRVGSENIVQVYDFTELVDGRLAFAMEVLRGVLLKAVIKEGLFEPSRAIGVLRQACKGLAAAHEAQVIHRDIKPSNIVLETVKGRPDTVKILDFGVATITADGDAGRDRGGTPLYVAPELIEGAPADGRCDIYSLGCTAFEMLIGRPPFGGASAKEVLLAHLEQPPPDIRELRPEVPAPLAAVIAKCLVKDPNQRYQNAKELEAALCEAQIEASLETSWDDLPLPDVDPERKEALLRRMPDPHGRRRSGRRTAIWVTAVASLAAVAIAAILLTRPDVVARTQIEELTLAAQAAAAEAYWVYPPPDDPKRPTAYTRVLELEGLEEAGAGEAAASLRGEFAGTLSRLGDEYWDRSGGKPFAIDYYAQALVFAPTDPVASERARLSPGQLAMLQEKAQAQGFSEHELIAVEPLIALAEQDPTKRGEKLAQMAGSGRVRAASTEASLEKLVGAPLVASADQTATAEEPDEAPIDEPEGAADPDSDTDAFTDDTEAVELEEAPDRPRDKSRSRTLAREGKVALGQGKNARAAELFEKALAADDRNPEALIGLARVHFERGAYATAARYGRKAVTLSPRKAGYRIHLGDAYYKAFKFPEAKAQYLKAAKLGHPEAKGRVAKVDKKLGG